jgi:hypothetical protein
VQADECRLVELAAHWPDLHHPDSQAPAEKTVPGAEQGRRLGGEGTPEVLEFCAAEFGAQMQTGYMSARSLMADALDLRHRHLELWQLILTGAVPSWKARKVAQAPAAQPSELYPAEPTARGLIIEPAGVEVRKLRPQVTRTSISAKKHWSATKTAHHDSAEASAALKVSDRSHWARSAASSPALAATYECRRSSTRPTAHQSTATRSRAGSEKPCSCACQPAASPTPPAPDSLELDHTEAYRSPARGGPPGQTGIHGLGPLIRFVHRVKTHGRWQVRLRTSDLVCLCARQTADLDDCQALTVKLPSLAKFMWTWHDRQMRSPHKLI